MYKRLTGRGRILGVTPGFTLIELLVVLAVLCVLTALLFPVFSAVRAVPAHRPDDTDPEGILTPRSCNWATCWQFPAPRRSDRASRTDRRSHRQTPGRSS